MANKSVLGVVLSGLIGILIFLILLAVANVVEIFIANDIFSEIIRFLNNNLGLILSFSIILFFGELFSIFRFPFNVPYPIINAVGSIYLITFLFRIVSLVERLLNQDFFPFNLVGLFIYPLVFIIVLIVGYVNVFKITEKPTKKEKKIKTKKHEDWKDDLREFREDANNLMNKINKELLTKKKKTKKKK